MLTTEDKEEIKRLIEETFTAWTLASTEGIGEEKVAPSQALTDSIIDITARAMEVFGTREKTLRWLRTPVRSPGDQTPVSLAGSPEGIVQVLDALGRVEHGVW